jgi:hypothetical protein
VTLGEESASGFVTEKILININSNTILNNIIKGGNYRFCSRKKSFLLMPHAVVLDSQRCVEIFELPHLFGQRQVAFFHHQFVFTLVDSQTLSTTAMPQLFGVGVVIPILVSLGSVTRV